MNGKKRFFLFSKRFGDLILSLFSLIVLSPFLCLVALAIKLESKGPILFKQKRVGKNKKLFNVLKFRSMKITAPSNTPTHMLSNPDSYITKVGKFIRKFSIDELPQLWNILKGDMSIIGPRPALWNQYDLIAERDKYQVNSLRPGLSGWAQIHGRDETSIKQKASLDAFYFSHMNSWLDIKIIFLTLFKVFKHEGIVEGKKE